MKKKSHLNTLVVLVNNTEDLSIIKRDLWYRIPVSAKIVPKIIKDKSVEYLAFYQSKKIKNESGVIRWYSKVKNISVVKRKELFPDNPIDFKADNEYYKIEIEKPQELEQPVFSFNPRRILFIPTTLDRLLKTDNINDLYYGSPLEEKVWNELKVEKISAERQYIITIDNKYYILDFALLCREKHIDLECDGDKYHLEVEQVKYDKNRNNDLVAAGWTVLRFGTEEIQSGMENIIVKVKKTIRKSGGLKVSDKKNSYRNFNHDKNQMTLFD